MRRRERPTVGADAAGKLQVDIILIGVVAVKGIQVGEMIAEFGAEVDVIPGEDGIAVAAGHGVRAGHGALGHQGHKVFDVKIDGALPGDAGMGKAAPEGLHGEGFQVVRGDGVAGGEAGAQAPAQIDEIEAPRAG